MRNSFLSLMPSPTELRKAVDLSSLPDFREVNAHIHTPYSFSPYEKMQTAFRIAEKENISVLGINDLYVTDGFDAFYEEAVIYKIFPMFNIELRGLDNEKKDNNIRLNDCKFPGRIYLCGKGVHYPFVTEHTIRKKLEEVIDEDQQIIKKKISRLNKLINSIDHSHIITYEGVRDRFARTLVRDYHLARAVRILAEENYASAEDQLLFIENLYGKKSNCSMSDHPGLEIEIRSNLLRNEDDESSYDAENSYLDLRMMFSIIVKSGGIPCYPALLNDKTGRFTEIESDPDKLYSFLKDSNIEAIEFLPEKNDPAILKDYADFFHKRGFLVFFGTGNNTPRMNPMKVTTMGSGELDESLKIINWESSCIVAAHQYLNARKDEGYLNKDWTQKSDEKEDFVLLGKMVIEYFNNMKSYET